MQSVYLKIVTSSSALDCHCLQWSSDRRRVWLRVSSRCQHMPQNICFALTGSFLHVAHRLIRHKDIINSWWRGKWWWVTRSLFCACISGNKLGSAHYSCLVSLFTISCCTVFFSFHRFSIWSRYLLEFFLFIIHWKETLNFDIIYERNLYAKYLLKYQVLNCLGYFCTKKNSTRGALGRFDGKVIRIKKHNDLRKGFCDKLIGFRVTFFNVTSRIVFYQNHFNKFGNFTCVYDCTICLRLNFVIFKWVMRYNFTKSVLSIWSKLPDISMVIF